MLDEAVRLIEAGDLYDAREILVDILYRDYDDLDAWLLLTRCALNDEEYARAVREALRIDPENVEARRLAVELARKAPDDADLSDTMRAVARRSMRSLINTILVAVVIGVGALLAIVLVLRDTDQDSASSQLLPTEDPVVACAEDVSRILERFQAACAYVGKNELCLASEPVQFDYVEPMSGDLRVRGDRTALLNVEVLNTSFYEPLKWGLVVVRGQTSFADSTEDAVLFVITGGVRLRVLTERMQSFTFSSNPVISTCPSVPPAGILMSVSPDKEAEFEVNGFSITLSGTAFAQVDTAAGLVIVAMEGRLVVAHRGDERVVQAGQWLSWPVDAQFQASTNPGDVMLSGNSIRGDLMQLVQVGEILGLQPDERWVLPGPPPAVAFVPSPTDTPIPTETPSPTASPTVTVTRTPTPPPPDLATGLPVLNTLTPHASRSSTPSTSSIVVGDWRCAVQTTDGTFSYFMTFESVGQELLQGEATLAEYDNIVVSLEGEWLATETDLDDNWAEVPGHDNGRLWLVLEETEIVEGETSREYETGRRLRLFLYRDDQMEGALFVGNEIIGRVIDCESIP